MKNLSTAQSMDMLLKDLTPKFRTSVLMAVSLFSCNAAFAVCDAELSNAISMTDQKNPDVQMGANWYRYNHAQDIKDPRGSADVVSLKRGIKTTEESIARGRIISDNFGPARARAHVSYGQYRLCMYKWRLDSFQNQQAQQSPQTSTPSGPMENCNALFTPERLKSLPGPQYVQEHINCLNRNLARSKAQVTTASTTPISQEAQQQAQQTQQVAAQNQTRADQARQGKRKTHEPAAEAHECIAIDNAGSGNFGAFKNTCSYRVNFYTCNYKPRVTQGGFNWSADFDCEKQQHGMHTPGAGVAVAAHNRNTETVHWFACKAPASPVDVSFVQGQGLSGRCN